MDISWYIPERILLLRSTLSSHQAAEIDETLSQVLKTSQTPLHLILDGQLIEQMPGFFILKRWQWPRQPGLGAVAAYGMKDKSLQAIVRVTSKLYGMKLSFHKTLEDAAAALRKQDSSLPEPIETLIPPDDPISRPTRELDPTSQLKIFKAQLMKVADRRCEFCRTPLPHAIELLIGELEPQDQLRFDKLCLECVYCHKFRANREGKIFDPLTLREADLFHPRKDRWHEHFAWSVDGLHLVGLTPTGRATIIHLRLHSQYHQNLRQIGINEGWHPPRKFTTSRLKNQYFPREGRLRIEIENPITGQTDTLFLSPRNPLIFGRSHSNLKQIADVDLETYGGYLMGVSRIHARIDPPENHTLLLTDLGSSNGTYVNNERLETFASRRLSDADQVRMGRLNMQIYFVE